MKRLLILLTLLIAQSIPTVAESREKDLDRWVERNLIPYVRQQLVIHPRFKNETVMFVVQGLSHILGSPIKGEVRPS